MTKWQRRFCLMLAALICITMGFTEPVYADECPHVFEERRAEATCTESGVAYDECILCGATANYRNIEPLGHEYGAWEISDAPSCLSGGEQIRYCTRSGCNTAETQSVPALGHDNSTTVYDASCESEGYTEDRCSRCGRVSKRDFVAALGHDLVSQVIAPTCTAKGYTLVTCKCCDYEQKHTATEKTPHTYDNGAVTKEPTETAMGRITYTCTGCGETRTETTPRLVNPFVDVIRSDYYYTPVLWAVNRGITTGVDETHFVPNATCTRAQVVTFLWRAAGSPAPGTTVCPFQDVSENGYYRNAVLWAVEHKITSGVSATRFAPNDPCTRAQVVTFLYRAAGSPEWNATDRFRDVRRDDYYYTCVSWAADLGITTGVDSLRFGPNQSCTRAQIVTFLYRDAHPKS